MPDQSTPVPPLPGREFSDSFVEADGFRIRYREAGQGEALVCLHGGGGLRLSRTHDILAGGRRVIAFEVPGFGESPVNERSETMEDLAGTMNAAISALGVDRYSLMGTSFGGKLALWMAIARPETVDSIVLIAPAAIRTTSVAPSSLSREEAIKLLYAHPERQPPEEPMPAAILEKQGALSKRLIGPPRDEAFETRLGEIDIPVLALFGTEDRVIPPDSAYLYREKLPNCHLMMVYDAAHAIDAERPEAVASVVDDFLTRQERFLVRDTSGLIHP